MVLGILTNPPAALEGIPEKLAVCFPPGGLVVSGSPDGVCNTNRLRGAGAYILIIRLNAPLELEVTARHHALPAGWYLYAGSARGPGGLRARVGRHMRPDKNPHWHIDKMTVKSPPTVAVCYPDYSEGDLTECELVRFLSKQKSCVAPIPGFGSTDCRTCTSHLLAWQADKDC